MSHYGHFPLGGARVEVTAGPAGDVKYTDANGYFMMDGMWGDTEFTATKDGYEPSVQRILVTRDVDTLNFALRPFGYIDITGTYSLRITAAADCRDLPEALRTRTYTAVVSSSFSVALSGADFLGNRFYGGMDERGVYFFTSHYLETGYSEFLERLTPSTALMIDFSLAPVRPTVSPTSLVGTMAGALSIVRIVGSDLDYEHPVASCSAHQFLMSR